MAKQSQYSFRHWDFVQLHGLRGRIPLALFGGFSLLDVIVFVVIVGELVVGSGEAETQTLLVYSQVSMYRI